MAHLIDLHQPVSHPEDGLMLGNGDLSISVYERDAGVVFRFGKGDVWDRRLDLSEDPKPARIDEVARGIRDEGWICNPYDGTGTRSLRTPADPERMRALCQGVPPSYARRPFPCPKPVGELVLRAAAATGPISVSQRLSIEEATLRIECTWGSGASVTCTAFIHPELNVLAVVWSTSDPGVAITCELMRWPDPRAETVVDYQPCERSTPLPPPTTVRTSRGWTIEQAFPADPTFPAGFRCLLAPLGTTSEPLAGDLPGARLRVTASGGSDPSDGGGSLLIAVSTSSDPDGPDATLAALDALVDGNVPRALRAWAEANRAAADAFWSRSSVSIADPLLEDLWYQTLHARRGAYRAGKIPPGLFMPSSLGDYSRWHGDWHTNYNFQQPFWGDYAANHLDIGDAYFVAIDYFRRIGRKIASECYGGRGAFIQLTGYPIDAENDPLGAVPMGRMAYMTGWAMNPYWWRYQCTLDLEWLRRVGYPALREGALFYTDFLSRRDDGLYHAFPSNQGEDGFTGEVAPYTDRPQVMRHARYCLRSAALASAELGVDADLRARWTDIIEHLAPEDGVAVPVEEELRIREDRNPPEFQAADGGPRAAHDRGSTATSLSRLYADFDWYCGKLPWMWMIALRRGMFVPERDLPQVRDLIRRWRQPNGLIRAMSVEGYGHPGGWTEPLGVIAPLQEMMLQSWNGMIEVFPCWPSDVDATFTTFRAEGAFLVSASWSNGNVGWVDILSERGARCRMREPWPSRTQVSDHQGIDLPVDRSHDGVLEFPTRANGRYRLLKA